MAQQTYELDGPKQFFFPFPVQQKSQLTLMVLPDGTPVPESEWDVTGAAPDASSVSVTWLTAPIDGTQQLTIARFTGVARVTDFVDDSAVPARALNAEFNNIYQILGEVEDRITDLENRMEAVELRLDDLENRMEAVELRLDAVEAAIATIFVQLGLLDDRITALEGRMTAAEGRLDDVESRLDAVEDNLGTSTYQVNTVTQALNVRTLNFQDSALLPNQFTVTQTGPDSATVEVRPDVPAVSGTVALHVGALVTRSGGGQQAIPVGVPTPVLFGDVQYDDVGIFDALEPARLTAPVGTTRVQLTAALQFQNADASLVEIRKNGMVFPGGTGGTESMAVIAGGAGRVGHVTAVVDAVAGDYFEVYVFSATGQVVLATGQTFFSMTLMQATGLLPAAGGALVTRAMDQVVADPSVPVPITFDSTAYDDADIVDGDGLRMPVSLSVDRCRLTGALQVTNAEDIQIYVAKNSSSATAPNFIGAASFKRINHSKVGEDDFYTISSPILEVAPGDIFRVLVQSANGEQLTIRGGNATWFSLELVGTPQPGFTAVSDFTGLTDTPDDYATFAGQAVAVNGTEDGLEFIPFPSAGGQVDSVVGGSNITVDDTDPVNPIAAHDPAQSMAFNAGVFINLGSGTSLRETNLGRTELLNADDIIIGHPAFDSFLSITDTNSVTLRGGNSTLVLSDTGTAHTVTSDNNVTINSNSLSTTLSVGDADKLSVLSDEVRMLQQVRALSSSGFQEGNPAYSFSGRIDAGLYCSSAATTDPIGLAVGAQAVFEAAWDGANISMAFFGATPVAQQSIDSSDTDTNRIAALEAALEAYGLVVDTAP